MSEAILNITDPSGVPFEQLAPAVLRAQRTSIKWTRYDADVLPLPVAEMDFTLAPEIKRTLIERIEASDTGYIDGPGPLAQAFADFARDRWAWRIPHDHVHLATDVATGVVEGLRVGRPAGGRLALPVPVYPGFYEMLEEVDFEVVEVPLRGLDAVSRTEVAEARTASGTLVTGTGTASTDAAPVGLDLAALEREFASPLGIDALLLSNPHNPHGIAFSRDELAALARLAAQYDVFVVSDEIHAPLTHSTAEFTPFAPLAAEAGALAIVVTSASKGWNLAGAKCSVIVAADDRANAVLAQLPPETTTRASILGLHAGVAAFRDGRDWLDRTITQVEANEQLLAELVAERLPAVGYARPRAGYLAWLDFRAAGLGDDPYRAALDRARVALGDGRFFGPGGSGFLRFNLACAPATIREAVDRIAAILPAPSPLPAPSAPPA